MNFLHFIVRQIVTELFAPRRINFCICRHMYNLHGVLFHPANFNKFNSDEFKT